MTSPNTTTSNTTNKVLEPSVRMKQLIDMSYNISVDKNISISKYFHSGKELIKSASLLEQKGDIEKAFILYLRYMTLFVEKLINHPEYSKAGRAEKTLFKNECDRVFDLAEDLKRRILDNYHKEYEESKQERTSISIGEEAVQKRSLIPQESSSPREPDIDEIDRKFNFSLHFDAKDEKEFDPFNVEELQRSFNTNE